jgi:hypothetical protein
MGVWEYGSVEVWMGKTANCFARRILYWRAKVGNPSTITPYAGSSQDSQSQL